MDRLWAPWRMGYIVNNSKDHTSCFLCEARKQNDDQKNYVLYRGRHSYVIMNLYPYNNGHLLVVPYAHVPDMNALSIDALTDLMKCTQDSLNALKQDMNPEGFNIGINIGKVAGAGLPEHMHIQIVPRWTGDTSYLTVFDETRVMPELLNGPYDRLRPYFETIED